MKGYTVIAQDIKEYRLVLVDTGEDIYTAHTEESAVNAFNDFMKRGARIEIQKIIRLIVDVDE